MLRRLAAQGYDRGALVIGSTIPIQLRTFASPAAGQPRLNEQQLGDPGPSTLKHSRKARAILFDKIWRSREGARAKTGDADLDQVPRARKPSSHVNVPRGLAPEHQRMNDVDHDRRQRDGSKQRFHPGYRPVLSLDPYSTSRRLKRYIDAHPSPMSMAGMATAIAIVTEAPKRATEAPTWNMLLGLLAKEGRMQQAWSLYNQMKKRGIKPTSRTYTIMLEGYADAAAEPASESTISVVESLFQQSEKHIRSVLPTSLASGDNGLELSEPISSFETMPDVDASAIDPEISLGPRHAYMRFHTRRADLLSSPAKILAVYQTFPAAGPLRPDTLTYSILLRALARLPASTNGVDHESKAVTRVTVLILTDALRSLEQPRRHVNKGEAAAGKRQIDDLLVQDAIAALLRGDQAGKDIALNVFASYTGLDSGHATSLRNQDTAKVPDAISALHALVAAMSQSESSTIFASRILDSALRTGHRSDAALLASRIARSPAFQDGLIQASRADRRRIQEGERIPAGLMVRCLAEQAGSGEQPMALISRELKRGLREYYQAGDRDQQRTQPMFLDALNASMRASVAERWTTAYSIFAVYTRATAEIVTGSATDDQTLAASTPVRAPGTQAMSLLLKIALSIDNVERKNERVALAAQDSGAAPVIVQAWQEYNRYTRDGTALAGPSASANLAQAGKRSMGVVNASSRDKSAYWLNELDRVARATRNAAEAAVEEVERRRRARQRNDVGH